MDVMNKNVAVIILAAGLGTRMKSNKAKVLHEIQGRPMVIYVVETAMEVAGNDVILVVGNQAAEVRKTVSEIAEFIFAFQEKQLGTGHAVLCALPYLPPYTQEVVILCGDVPLITPEMLAELIDDHIQAQRDITLLAVEFENPTGYGRVLLDEDEQVCAIVEESDATAEQRQIKIINTGIYCVKKQLLHDAIPTITTGNIQGEMYLTDIIEIAYRRKKKVGMKVGNDPLAVIGVNNLQDLARVEAVMQKRSQNIT